MACYDVLVFRLQQELSSRRPPGPMTIAAAPEVDCQGSDLSSLTSMLRDLEQVPHSSVAPISYL